MMSGQGAKTKPIADEAAWDAMLAESKASPMIFVVDVFKDWSGPCTVMQIFFDRLVSIVKQAALQASKPSGL